MSDIIISAADVKQLRDQTGAGMMDCKKALVEAKGDFEKAVEYLRKKGQKVSDKRADREANEGVVIASLSDDNKRGVVIKLGSETDFVAKNENFINLTQKIAEHALKLWPADLDQLLDSNFEGVVLRDKILETVAAIGEKIQLSNFEKVEAPLVVSYIHMGNKAGVLLGMNLDNDDFIEVGRNLAMQVAAMRPISLDKDGINSTIIEKEIEIGKEQARREGKPEAMLDKIALGKLNKFYKENTLLNQVYVKDGKLSVTEYLKSANKDLKVTEFKHVKLG
jgi:elongation factor Ts